MDNVDNAELRLRAKAAFDAACEVFSDMDTHRERAARNAPSHRHDWIEENPFAQALSNLGELPDAWLDALLARAQTDRGAFDLARRETADAVRNGKPLSPAARRFVASVLLDGKRPAKKRGRPPEKTRDRALVWAVAYLKNRHGLRPTRNDATAERDRDESACGIVAEALGLRYDTVRKVWDRRASPELWPVSEIIGEASRRA